MPPGSGPPSTLGPGLAHGLAGVAVALAHAWRLDGDPDHLSRVADVEARENAWFSPEVGGWPDARDPTHHPAWWCHGATGIGLARHRVTALTGVPSGDVSRARDAVVGAIDTGALSHGDWSLCHGLGGATALLLTAAPVGVATRDVDRARALLVDGSRVARERGGWPGGAPVPTRQVGLMTGEAGLLLVLVLALRTPQAVPWPLWL